MKKIVMIFIELLKSIFRVLLWMVLAPIWVFPVLIRLADKIELKQLDLANKIMRLLK